MTVASRSVQSFGPTAEGHFWKRVDRNGAGGCWLWIGRLVPTGYGEFTYHATDGRTRHIRAHRAAWELLNGPIPDNAFLDHLCEMRRCVNPAHLEPVTARQNTHRMLTRKTGGRDIRIPDAVWDAAAEAAVCVGDDLTAVVVEFMRSYATRPRPEIEPITLF